MKYLIPIILATTSLTLWGQSLDSVKLENVTDQQGRAIKQHDSLRKKFDNILPFFRISLEVNQEQVAIPQRAKFYATSGQQIFGSTTEADGEHKFDDLPDSVQFVLEFDSVKLTTGYINKGEYENGARFTFGYFDNVLELNRKLNKGKKDSYFDEWKDLGSPYLTAAQDKRIIKAARLGKIGAIEFVVFVPKTFGHETLTTFQIVRPR